MVFARLDRTLAAALLAGFVLICARPATAQTAASDPQRAQSELLFILANKARAAQGAPLLTWDPALAAAALAHCRRMAAEGEISHRYGDEPDLSERAGKAGAHFSLIEENVALGSTAPRIHDGWMNSPGHRANLLNPSVDRVGIAVVPAAGVLYAVADYARTVQVLSAAQVESTIAALIRPSGVAIRQDPGIARLACAMDHGLPAAAASAPPEFLMRWQNPDLTQLPPDLNEKLASGRYSQAAIGSCPAQNVEGSFTVYRVAVMLYSSSARPKAYE
jgi:uncharacterized protein YkwD